MSIQEINTPQAPLDENDTLIHCKSSTVNPKSSQLRRRLSSKALSETSLNTNIPKQNNKKVKGAAKSSMEEEDQAIRMETEQEGTRNSFNLRANVTRSRQIHKHLMRKKNQWKPNDAELDMVKTYFEQNKYPTKEEKLALLCSLQEKTQSKVDLNQITKWFQYEREKTLKQSSEYIAKNTYKKFSQEELLFLREQFSQNTYPKTEEMKDIARRLKVSLSKIENWYKHNRRSLAKKGFFVLKTKKYFKKEEIAYLVKMFETHPRPSKEQVLEMARNLSCSESQIKNWYSNKRKKQKLVLKKQTNENKDSQLEDLAVKSCSSMKQSQDCLSSPSSDVPTTLHSSLSLGSLIQRKDSEDSKISLTLNKGFKSYSQDESTKGAHPLIIPKPVTNVPLLRLRTNIMENLKLNVEEIKNHPLKDASQRINSIPKLSSSTDSTESFFSDKTQTSPQISPSFRLNTSAKINTDSMSKLLSPNNLSQLQNSLLALANKGTAATNQKTSSNLQGLMNNQNFINRPQKAGIYDNYLHLKYLASLYYLNNNPLLNAFGSSLLFNNSEHLLQNLPPLHPRFEEQSAKATPIFSHSLLSRLKSNEKSSFNPRNLDKEVETKKF